MGEGWDRGRVLDSPLIRSRNVFSGRQRGRVSKPRPSPSKKAQDKQRSDEQKDVKWEIDNRSFGSAIGNPTEL